MLNLKESEILTFIDLVKTGSFSKTAGNIKMKQANVSKLINSMEEKVGVKIFERDTRPVKLTNFGLELYPFIEKHINGLRGLSHFVDNYKHEPHGVVRIYAPTGIQAFLMRMLVPEFIKAHPEITLSFVTQTPLAGEFYSGSLLPDGCDILITYMPSKLENVVARKLSKIRLDIYASEVFNKEHPFKHPHELVDYPFILISSLMKSELTNELEFIDRETNEIISVTVTGNIEFDNSHIAREYCKNGMGYLVHSAHMMESEKELKPCLDSRYELHIHPYIIYRKREHQPFRVKTFLDFLLARLPQEIP